MKKALLKQLAFSGIRLIVLLYLAVLAANYLNGRNFSDYLGRTMIKVHAEGKMGPDANQLSRLLLEKDTRTLQGLLDRNYNIYALVITDCRTGNDTCPGQNILFQTNPTLIPDEHIDAGSLDNFPYVLLRRQSSSILQLLRKEGGAAGHSGEIIGRVYSISTIPSFKEDYRNWLSDPFRDNELWRTYLKTMTGCLLASLFVWLVLELLLKLRRTEVRNARQREAELMRDVDNYLNQLDEKGRQIEEQQNLSNSQFATYIGRIRELEQRLQDVGEHRQVAEQIIRDLEEDNLRRSAELKGQLDRTRAEKEQLRTEVERYKRSVGRDRVEASNALSSAIGTRTGAAFEQQVIDRIVGSDKGKSGEWRLVTNFDVSGGQGGSRFVDCIVISKECLVVVEVKGYYGTIEAEGSVENSTWLCRGSNNRIVEIRGEGGDNPYHQVHDYVVNLMNLVKKRLPQLPVFGVIVFPEKSDISGIGTSIGRFYRITGADRLLSVLGQMEAEARRGHPFSKRPSLAEIEDVMRGK
ncbi:nuclease-related domain-containing protein [Geotalea sp. SG265]|uniref:nuclease-related domain-containing protein n=1 Tax=Geotalea sp. SG265 TaxID=2922867 RepID=UPI001FAF7542|nr:nuclease-related domain-containing protein [Geotalea sp. SG265]